MCEFAGVQEAVRDALRRLYRIDFGLIEREVNERSITHWLAIYLRESFPDWDVDCEYNRNGTDPKRLAIDPVEVRSDDIGGKTVYPDIIVHRRGCRGRGANLLVIEAKKAWTGESPDEDRRKLEEFRRSDDFAYRFGALVLFSCKGAQIEWYEDGQHDVEAEILDLVQKENGHGA